MIATDPAQTVPVARVGLEAGSGALLGALAGFAAKKVAKLAAAVAGSLIALLAALEAEGLVLVRWGALREYLATHVDPGTPAPLLELAGHLPVGGGFAVGAVVGFRKG